MQPTQPPVGGYDPYVQFPGCYRHPDRPTGVRCVRCNRPICPECQRPASVGFQCPDDVAAGAASIRRGRTIVGAPVSSAPPFISYGLIAINVIAYIATALSPGGTLADNRRSDLFSDWLLVPSLVGHQHEYYRMISAAFLHIGPIHLAFNMFALYMVGPGVERALGWWRFLAVYLLGALGGSVAMLVFGQVNGAVAGASGAIFGLFACALLLTKVVGLDPRSLIITIVLNFVITFSVPGISKLGHVGGFVFGGLATLALLGWHLGSGTLKNRHPQMQIAGLAGLLAILLIATVWRTADIGSQRTAVTVGLVSQTTATTQGPPEVIHIVDGPGENYTRVITAVEEPVDNPVSGRPAG
ncbi:rhomboid family intramembrane serine protease [Jatrophihabitans sp. DSM 45814]